MLINLVRQKNIQPLKASDKRNEAKPHTPVPFDLHTYMNQLTTNSDNTTNENLKTERDRPMTSNNAKSFEFKENIENAKKKVKWHGNMWLCNVTFICFFY